VPFHVPEGPFSQREAQRDGPVPWRCTFAGKAPEGAQREKNRASGGCAYTARGARSVSGVPYSLWECCLSSQLRPVTLRNLSYPNILQMNRVIL
jgi:hypothetical protein